MPECSVADPLLNTNPLKLLAAKVASAPLSIPTYPPFSLIANAVPPEKTYISPPLFTVVSFAMPPGDTVMCPHSFTEVAVAVPPLPTPITPS